MGKGNGSPPAPAACGVAMGSCRNSVYNCARSLPIAPGWPGTMIGIPPGPTAGITYPAWWKAWVCAWAAAPFMFPGGESGAAIREVPALAREVGGFLVRLSFGDDGLLAIAAAGLFGERSGSPSGS